jgi:cyclopropane-fatty-acyl-phospholipid synthase
VDREGLADRIDLWLADYRDVEGRFDKIVSVEMLEAVGARDLGGFFATCDRLLQPGGKVVLQVITIADHRYQNYVRHGDWIQKEIFPGQTLASREVLDRARRESGGFEIRHEESLADDYARTLRDWRVRLEASWARARELGYEESFLRKWRYYFCYCEAGFLTREIDDWQLVLERSG